MHTRASRSRGFTLLELMVTVVIGVLAVIAIPSFLRYQLRADLDGDGVSSFFAYVKPGKSGNGLPGALPGTTCVGSGVYSPNSGGPFGLYAAGPCDADSGRSRF